MKTWFIRRIFPGLLRVCLLPLLALAFPVVAQAQVVEIESVSLSSWSEQLVALGTLAARDQVVITSNVDGFIERLNIQDGQRVEAGQNLLKLDSRLEQANLADAEAKLQEDQRRLQELKQLFAKKAVSESELASQEALVAQSEAQVKAAVTVLSFYSLQAPFPGVLGLNQLSVGQYIQPGQKLVSLTNLDSLYVDFNLPSKQLGNLEPGLQLSMTFDAWPGQVFTGTLATIDPAVDPQSGNLTARGNLDNRENLLYPGLLARVTLDMEAEEVIQVSTSSLYYRGTQAYVYSVDEQGVAREQAVTTGTVRGSSTVIVDGLSVGDRIISTGVGKVRQGAVVQDTHQAEPMQREAR